MSTDDPLRTAIGLQAYVMLIDEAQCEVLLEREKASRRRLSFMLRIHSRINYLRAHRERIELTKIASARR